MPRALGGGARHNFGFKVGQHRPGGVRNKIPIGRVLRIVAPQDEPILIGCQKRWLDACAMNLGLESAVVRGDIETSLPHRAGVVRFEQLGGEVARVEVNVMPATGILLPCDRQHDRPRQPVSLEHLADVHRLCNDLCNAGPPRLVGGGAVRRAVPVYDRKSFVSERNDEIQRSAAEERGRKVVGHSQRYNCGLNIDMASHSARGYCFP